VLSRDEIDPLVSDILPHVAVPPVIFPIVGLSAICATTMFMTVNPEIDNVATPERIANIANILIVFISEYEVLTSIYDYEQLVL
jgi:hypothetical protein